MRVVKPAMSASPTASSSGSSSEPCPAAFSATAATRVAMAATCRCQECTSPRSSSALIDGMRSRKSRRAWSSLSSYLLARCSTIVSVCQATSRSIECPIARTNDTPASLDSANSSRAPMKLPITAASDAVNAGTSGAGTGRPSARQ